MNVMTGESRRVLRIVGLTALGILLMGAIPECYSEAEFGRQLQEDAYLAYPQYIPQWSQDGTFIVFGHGNGAYLVDSEGTAVNSVTEGDGAEGLAAIDYSPVISADGSRVAYTTLRHKTGFGVGAVRGFELAYLSIEDSRQHRLTKNKAVDTNASWSPDGKLIAFVSDRDSEFGGRFGLYIMDADGSDERRIEPVDVAASVAPQWSPGGKHIAFLSSDDSNKGVHLYTVRADGSELRKVSEERVELVRWSPDGSRLAIARIEGGKAKIDVMNADGSGARRVLEMVQEEDSDGASWGPPTSMNSISWSPDGSKILFVPSYGDRSMISIASVDGSEVRHLTGYVDRSYASWSPNGSRIIIHTHPMPDLLAKLPQGVILYTIAADGSDMRVLVRGGSGRLVAENSGWQDVTDDIAECSEGFVVPDPKENSGLVQDCETLFSARDTLAGGGMVLGWSSDTPVSEWIGVRVGGDPLRVQKLILRDLAGSIPPQLSRLTGLERLFLGDQLTGPIPPELGNLSRLTHFSIENNRISGEIPPELGRLSSLEGLWLQWNELGGSIPAELANLTNLVNLRLEKNWRLTGEIPPELGKLVNLEELTLTDTEVTGCIPEELVSNPRLKIHTDGLEPC